jgi:ABC-type polysaccharide/polyol phosphate export permease
MRRITVYKSNQRRRMNPLKVYQAIIKNLIKSRELIATLFIRDFFLAYKRSFFGYGWLFAAPLFTTLTWVFMNMTGVLQPGNIGVPYPVYALIGTSIWVMFQGLYTQVTDSFTAGMALMTTVKYHHESLLFSQALKPVTNFIISSLLNLIILLAFGIYPTVQWLVLPLTFLPLIFFGVAIGAIFCIIRTAMPDLEKTFTYLFPLWMYVTPIIFSASDRTGWFKVIIQYNPLTYLIGLNRDIIVYGNSMIWHGYFICSGIIIIFFLMALRFFYITEEVLVEKIY